MACAYIFEPLFCRLIVFTTPYITNIWTDFSVGVLYCLFVCPLYPIHITEPALASFLETRYRFGVEAIIISS